MNIFRKKLLYKNYELPNHGRQLVYINHYIFGNDGNTIHIFFRGN